MEIDEIEFRKFFSKIKHKAEDLSKPEKCALCGKQCSSFCNSHSVPQMVLKQISGAGKYRNNLNGIFKPFDSLTEFGLNNTGTFKIICNDCDKKYFVGYESEQFMDSLFSSEEINAKMISEMFLKCGIHELYKKTFASNVTTLANEIGYFQTSHAADELNLKEFEWIKTRSKNALESGKGNYHQIYRTILDHQSEIACQCLVPLQGIPTQEIINDVFNYDPNYRIVSLLFLCLPWKGRTYVSIISFKEDEERLNPFIKYFGGLNETSKLKLFQSALFSLTEEVYLSLELSKKIQSDESMQKMMVNGLETARAIKTEDNRNVIISKPKLITLNGFRKTKIYI